eukprot:6203876-Pleurochrysis_carterae.AAC.1
MSAVCRGYAWSVSLAIMCQTFSMFSSMPKHSPFQVPKQGKTALALWTTTTVQTYTIQVPNLHPIAKPTPHVWSNANPSVDSRRGRKGQFSRVLAKLSRNTQIVYVTSQCCKRRSTTSFTRRTC